MVNLQVSNWFLISDTEETKVLIVATIVYGLRKSSRAMVLLLLFLIALNPGLIPALYSKISY